MKCVTGIDLGSTTTKAVLLDEHGAVAGQGITNSRSNYEVACAVAREEALVSARFNLLNAALTRRSGENADTQRVAGALPDAFRLELYLDELGELADELERCLRTTVAADAQGALGAALRHVLDVMERDAPALFADDGSRRSDFFRDLAGTAVEVLQHV